MERYLGRFQPQIYAILRIITGIMFALHGSQKLFGWPGETMATLPPLIVAAGIIEFVGGLMIAFGFFGSFAAFIASGTMAVAYFKGHASGGFFPTVNQGELAVVYCFLFLFFAARGSGIWSIDSVVGKKSR